MQNIKSAHEALRSAADGNTISNSTDEMKKLYASMVDINTVFKKFKKDNNSPY